VVSRGIPFKIGPDRLHDHLLLVFAADAIAHASLASYPVRASCTSTLLILHRLIGFRRYRANSFNLRADTTAAPRFCPPHRCPAETAPGNPMQTTKGIIITQIRLLNDRGSPRKTILLAIP
jgi:hypothetical protein